MNGKNKLIILWGLLICIVVACSGEKQQQADEIPNTPTSGKLRVFCEEGISLHLGYQAYTFEKVYKHATITIKPSNEKEAIEGLFNDSCKAIAITRGLSSAETALFNKANLYPQSVFVAKTAIALVCSRNCLDSVITTSQIKALLAGDTNTSITARQVVFDNQNSGAIRYLKDSLIPGKVFGKNCHAASSTNELIELVKNNKNCIGVMNYAWLSDRDDSITKQWLKDIKIIPVARTVNEVAYFPDQSNIQTGDYPFCRKIYLIRRSDDFTLATGFITFVAGSKGQIMMLKAGLAPVRQPERVIEVDMNPLTPEH